MQACGGKPCQHRIKISGLHHPCCLQFIEEQALPASWKYANITPLSKTKPVTIIAKHIRPISLTSALSKLAEDFIVKNYVGPAVLEIIDPDQFGAIPKSSTTQALLSIVHAWTSATDGTGAAVRIILLDYKKAFDLIDHSILVIECHVAFECHVV